MNAIKAQHLHKSYGDFVALDDVSFEVKNNEIFGLIGPDGAGKTTIIKILATLLLSDGGKCEILGQDLVLHYENIRTQLGYMPATFSLYADLSVKENLDFFAHIFGANLEENYELIKPIYRSLEAFKHRKAGALSGGMKQKLALCAALIHKPKILLLDEPSTGVDALSRAEFWDILKKLKTQMSIVVSTPYMDEASLCDTIALISQGQFLRVGTPNELIANFKHKLYVLKNLPLFMLKHLRSLKEIKNAVLFGDSIHLTLHHKSSLKTPAALEKYLSEKLPSPLHNKQSLHVENIAPNIEDCFMEFLQ